MAQLMVDRDYIKNGHVLNVNKETYAFWKNGHNVSR